MNNIKKIAKISLSTYVCDIQPIDGPVLATSFDSLVFHMRLAFVVRDVKIVSYEIEFDFNINNCDVTTQSEEMLQYVINNCKLIEYSQNYLDVIITAYKPFVDSWVVVREKHADKIASSTVNTIDGIHKAFIEAIITDVLSKEEYYNSFQLNKIREKYAYLMPNIPIAYLAYSSNNSNSSNNNSNNNMNHSSNFNNNVNKQQGSPSSSPPTNKTITTTTTSSMTTSSFTSSSSSLSSSSISFGGSVVPTWLVGNQEYLDSVDRHNATLARIEKELENRMSVISADRAKKEESYKRDKEQLINKLEDLKSQLITMQDKQKERIHEVEERKKQLEKRP